MNQRLLLKSGFTATRALAPTRTNNGHTRFSHGSESTRRDRPHGFHDNHPLFQDAAPMRTTAVAKPAETEPLGHRAKLKQSDKEFFVDLLTSAATKRDARAYLTRLKSPTRRKSTNLPTDHEARSMVNLGSLFGAARSVDTKPVFIQHLRDEEGFQEQELQHTAVVKLSDIESSSAAMRKGIAQTLSQLSRLSMSPCVVLDIEPTTPGDLRRQLAYEAEKLSSDFDVLTERGARVLDSIFTISVFGKLRISSPRLLDAPLKRGQIPIILPIAYSDSDQRLVVVGADDAILAVVAELSGISQDVQPEEDVVDKLWHHAAQQVRSSVDRIIIIDKDGGIPNPASPDGKHVFLNLAQEFAGVVESVHESMNKTATKHISNLELLKNALKFLPHSSSGLMTSPTEASNLRHAGDPDSGPVVGTRRQKNALIHNLLTDRPAYSASLPKTRLARSTPGSLPPAVSTFVKRGMPVKMFPDPLVQQWSADLPRIKLTDASIDLDRLVYLVNDSFNRDLDVDKYLERVNERIAGVIIAGDYEGGAILTWETPPGVNPQDESRQVPYLDKFAVLKKSQGAGGVADIVFNAMVRTCFPNGVCWRSRKNNPVNKWYFERSTGTWKIPDMQWTMFWTTSGIGYDSRTFDDYEQVCRNIQPTWKDIPKPTN